MPKSVRTFINPSLIVSFLAVLTLFFLVIFSGYAQDIISSQSLEISPPSQEIQADPGTTLTIKAQVRNTSDRTLPIKVRIEDFTAQGEEGQIALVSESPYSLTSWTTLSPATFNLASKESREVTAQVKIPTDAAGGRYGSFVFSIVSDEPTQESAAKVAQEVASLFLIKISGPVSENLLISEFTAPRFSEFGPVSFNLKFRNSGNVHVKTFGLVHVRDMFGQKVDDIVVQGTNVFPESQRAVHPELNKRFLFGSYTATALMNYGSKNESITSVASFIVFPVRLVGIALLIIVILFLSRKRLKKALRAIMKG